jgi:hypothetical protein
VMALGTSEYRGGGNMLPAPLTPLAPFAYTADMVDETRRRRVRG